METAIIELTASAIKEHRLDIRACGKEFFPIDAIGGSSKKTRIGNPVTLIPQGLSCSVKTDIPTDKRSGCIRWIFRERTWMGDFVRANSLIPGDRIVIRHVRNRTYEVVPEKRQLTFIDLFAGIGGTRIAFEAAGCKCVFSSEWDRFAQQTYEANFGEKPHGDIRQIPSSEIPDHDILVAGFPGGLFYRPFYYRNRFLI